MDQNDRTPFENDELRENELQNASDAPLDAASEQTSPDEDGNTAASTEATAAPDRADTNEQAPTIAQEPVTELLPQDDAPVPKKRSKKPLILSLSITGGVLLIAAAVLLFLFWPIMTLDPVGNTLDAVLFDSDAMEDLFAAFEKRGAQTNVSIKLPPAANSSFALTVDAASTVIGRDQKETGKTLLTLACGEESFEVTVWWNAETVVLEGLSSIGAVSLPRVGADQVLESSIFHPDSKSKFALEKESYEQLSRLLKALDSRPVDERDDADVAKRLTAILTDWMDEIESESNYFFDKDSFQMSKKVTYTLTDGNIRDLLNDVIDEFRDELRETEVTPAEAGGPTNMLDALKELRNELLPSTYTLSYTVKERRLSFVKLVYLMEGEGQKDRFELWLTFVYEKDACGFDMEMLVQQEQDRFEREEGTVAKFRKTEQDGKISFGFTGENYEIIRGSGATSSNATFDISLDYVRESKSYILTGTLTQRKDGEQPVTVTAAIKGQFALEPKHKLWLTLDRIAINGGVQLKDLFEIDMTVCESKPQIDLPESIPLFEMDAAAFHGFARGLRVGDLWEILGVYVGQMPDMPCTVDGYFLYDFEECMEIANIAAEQYKRYLLDTFNPVKHIYVYNARLDIYILLDCNTGSSVQIGFAQSLSDQQSAKYRKATLVNGALTVENESAPLMQASYR